MSSGGAWKSRSVTTKKEDGQSGESTSWRARERLGSTAANSQTNSAPPWRRSSNTSSSTSWGKPVAPNSDYQKPKTFNPSYGWGGSGSSRDKGSLIETSSSTSWGKPAAPNSDYQKPKTFNPSYGWGGSGSTRDKGSLIETSSSTSWGKPAAPNSDYQKPKTFNQSYGWEGSGSTRGKGSSIENTNTQGVWRKGPQSPTAVSSSSWRSSGTQQGAKVCSYYQKGDCIHGNSCRFVHQEAPEEEDNYSTFMFDSTSPEFAYSEQSGGDAELRAEFDSIRQNGTNRTQDRDSLIQKLRDLSRMIASDAPLSPSQAEAFLSLGNEVLDSGSSSSQEKFIHALATEDGLRRIVSFVEAQYTTEDGGIVESMSFWHHCVPFLNLISHEAIRDSFVFENQVGTIYNLIYGLSGARAIPFFSSVVNHLLHSTTVNFKSSQFADAVAAATRGIWMTLKANQSAAVQEEFVQITQSLRKYHNEHLMLASDNVARTLNADIRRIEQKLQIAESIPETEIPQNQPDTDISTGTEFLTEANLDFPGKFSLHGPRHDNDHAFIEDMRILPTANEVMATSRVEYLPLRNFHPKAHFIPAGISRIVDTQFRLLREDKCGQIRDALRYILRREEDDQGMLESSRHRNVARMIKYTNVRMEDLRSSERDGMQLVVTFDQPSSLLRMRPDVDERRKFWTESRNLQVGALLCLVDEQDEFKFTFLLVTERIVDVNTELMNEKFQVPRGTIQDLSGNATRALITLKFVDFQNDIPQVAQKYAQQSQYNHKYILPYLIEFPGVLYVSFAPILESLQNIISSGEMPFTDFLAPEGNEENHPTAAAEKCSLIDVPPPLYLEDVSLDLTTIMEDPHSQTRLTHSIKQPCSIEELEAQTSLDRGQCEALISSLSQKFALIQGPPGTGKSYVGLQLVRVLLGNFFWKKLGPIVCVCYTNHALDQFLMELLSHGVRDIVRIGSKSKVPELREFSLRNIVGLKEEGESTYEERQEIRDYKERLGMGISRLNTDCVHLDRAHSWQELRNHLAIHYRHFHQQLFGSRDEILKGFVRVTHRKPHQVINDWLNLRFLVNLDKVSEGPKSIEDLIACDDLSKISGPDRRRLKDHWVKEIVDGVLNRLKDNVSDFQTIKDSIATVYHDRELRCLQSAQIVGVTTNGLAMHAKLLKGLRAKVLICEEAGEVLEAHLLTAILPSIEHAILIGDHQQLRPQIDNFNLSLETPRGEKYALNESLFERLTRERYGANKNLRFPLSSLDTQRRMHPSIANLIRQTLYSNLKDHQTVADYPEVDGMARRLFWMDHMEQEANADNADPSSNTSKSNDFELDMVSALVKHLIKQGTYKEGEIAVLTPYLGQMMKLRRRLGDMFEILVGERDQEDINIAESIENTKLSTTLPTVTKPAQNVLKGKLLNHLRLATVDNFQGEEARVIIISLVRCNKRRDCGFLRTSNRINVLLSRARHGMYIIGSAETARPVHMWSQVLTLLKRDGNLGDALELRCPRHQDKMIFVQRPDDFLRVAPEGGCDERCGKRLEQCGHACPQKCHAKGLHNAVICQEECTRKLEGCEHACPVKCGKQCKPCIVPILQVPLPCGHVASPVPCHQAQHPESVRCKQSVMKEVPACGHVVDVACYLDVTSTQYECPVRCDQNLECGHTCTRKCHECRSNETPATHKKCLNPCGRSINTCGHVCTQLCHEGKDCGFCDKRCEFSCSHSKCEKRCSDICTPCALECKSGCVHSGECSMPCAVACDILPCSKRCDQPLKCGHQCPSLCGEPCPSEQYCQECASDEDLTHMVGMKTFKEINLDANPIIFLSCGHFFCMETVDDFMQMNQVYHLDQQGTIISPKPRKSWMQRIDLTKIRCPECQSPSLTNINRYNRIIKGLMIETLTKRLTAKADQIFLTLEEEVTATENHLNDYTSTFEQEVRASFSITAFTEQRYTKLKTLLTKLRRFTLSATKDAEPYTRIYDLVADSTRRRQTSMAEHDHMTNDNSNLLRNRLLLQMLQLQLEWALLADMHSVRCCLIESTQVAKLSEDILKELPRLKGQCLQLERDAVKACQPRYQVEAKLFHARFISLELALPTRPPHKEYISKIREAERSSLDEALTICHENQNCTRGLQSLIEEAVNMLKDSVILSSNSGAKYSAPRSEDHAEVEAVSRAREEDIGDRFGRMAV